MTEEPDVAGATLHSGVLRMLGRQLVELHIEDLFAVEHNLELRPMDRDDLGVPLAHRPQVAALCGHHAVDRAVILVRLQLRVLLRAIKEEL